MRVLAIPGSVRAASSNVALLHALSALAPDGVQIELYEGLVELPMFSPDVADAALPAAVTELSARVAAADAVIICTPEYAFGMPGVLKNALDWLVSSGDLYEKPVAALSASPNEGGAARALGWLRETLSAHHAYVPAGATFAIPFVRKLLGPAGVVDPALVAALRGALESLSVAVAARAAG
ncbi:MAG: NADPH-dependent FMN reductase [Polyangiaceae bacterium]